MGSGPAGVAAAESFREHDAAMPVRILTADIDLPYARPPLSKEYLRGQTDDVALHPARWFDDRAIEITRGAEVDRLDVGVRAVFVGDAAPCVRQADLGLRGGAHRPTVSRRATRTAVALAGRRRRTTRRRADRRVRRGHRIRLHRLRGGRFLALRGVPVTLVAPEPLPQEKRLGTEAAERLRDLVNEAGARHVGGVTVEEITDAGVRLDSGVTIDSDLVLAATGVTPQSRVAAEAGLQIRDSRIVVDSDMATSAPDVYAAGDVALARHEVAGRHLAIEHWQDAVDQGSIAGACAAASPTKWSGVPGFWTSIGDATLKYHAWGDGYERSRMVYRRDGFTVWYESGDEAVGVLTYNADDDYDLGERLIAERRPPPVSTR